MPDVACDLGLLGFRGFPTGLRVPGVADATTCEMSRSMSDRLMT